jgi:carbon monoxide dehydrogenase subunit G
MARIRVSVVLDAPPAIVWADLEDIGSHVQWMADARSIRFLSEQRSGRGTAFLCDTRIGPFRLNDVMEITEWSPGKAMGVRHTGLVSGEGRFTLSAKGSGQTRFTWKEQLRYPWWLGGPFGAFVSKPILKRIWRGNLRRLALRF